MVGASYMDRSPGGPIPLRDRTVNGVGGSLSRTPTPRVPIRYAAINLMQLPRCL
ncbi:ORF 12 [Haloarcula hispanica virus SH1]|uniref:ORF 12 n=1 Tax=Haloarcula hispanica SH1 virus TaxID=326574 RepID=Q4KPH5_9VIRU|nr:ORF 12 [Haloarcula hispanica virus SH1]AAY24938.1 ORF 12 [Haloarcula hispanica virus SH1]